jgi:hypothetical protein
VLTDRLDHKRPVIFQESSIASSDELELEVGERTADGENNSTLNETTLSMTPHSCTTCITDEKLKDYRQFEDMIRNERSVLVFEVHCGQRNFRSTFIDYVI